MSKPRACPNCKRRIPIATGFHFDKDLNMICDRCNKPVITTAIEKEEPIAVVTNTNTNTNQYRGGYGGYPNPQNQNPQNPNGMHSRGYYP